MIVALQKTRHQSSAWSQWFLLKEVREDGPSFFFKKKHAITFNYIKGELTQSLVSDFFIYGSNVNTYYKFDWLGMSEISIFFFI